MAKETIPFSDFLNTVPQENTAFVKDINDFLLANDCAASIKEAKSGYVVSYSYVPEKKVMFNYVFRKSGLMIRLYLDNIQQYMEVLDTMPQQMKDLAAKASPCKRMLDPTACNSRCLMGFDFIMDGTRYQNCRNGAFMFPVTKETKPTIETLLRKELEQRMVKQ